MDLIYGCTYTNQVGIDLCYKIKEIRNIFWWDML